MTEPFLGVNPWTALFTLLNTLTIFFVGKKFLFAPVMKIIQERQTEIDTLYADANAAKKQAQSMEAEYAQKLSAADDTCERLVKEAVARGQAREEEIILKANSNATALMDKAAADIAMEKRRAINDAKDEISDMAMAIAEKVVGRELNAQDHTKLVDAFIEELGDQA